MPSESNTRGRTIARRPTIDDVARVSGVARTTVSRVLNNGPNVRDTVRARVFEAVETLGYQVNVQARSLAGGNSRTVALICPSDPESEPNSYYQAALELGALRACSGLGIQLITQTVLPDGDTARQAVLDLVRDHRCDGVMLSPPFSDDVAMVRALLARRCAVACISPGLAKPLPAPSVGMDDNAAGAELARHLIEDGHRSFGLIKGLAGHAAAERRFAGVARTLDAAGIAATGIAEERGNFTFKSGIDLLPVLLDRAPHTTAVICANDDTAAGALFAAHQMGITVPADLSITGFDDTPVSGIVWPPLTTVHQPIKELAAHAVELVTAQLKDGGDTVDVSHVNLPYALMVRGSTAPAQRRHS